MVNKMLLIFVLVRMASCDWRRWPELDLLEILDMMIYFGW
jgi:hypothetical protein